MSDTRAAAERLRTTFESIIRSYADGIHNSQDWWDEYYAFLHDGKRPIDAMLDRLIEAAYLSTVRADDDELVDWKFLDANFTCEHRDSSYRLWTLGTVGIYALTASWCAAEPHCGESIAVYYDGRLILRNPTVGQLRNLCRCLSIELKEPLPAASEVSRG